MSNISFIGLGTNIGSREKNLNKALQLLTNDGSLTLLDSSSIYETDPVGYLDQDPFLNMIVKVKTSLNPEQLLNKCQQIEKICGRKREIRWGPRIIDLDILLYNQENIETKNLSIPHPRMIERAFVLIPLLEIEPNIKIPLVKSSPRKMIEHLPDRKGVRIWKRKNGGDVFALFEN